jgi:hypothetical protein
VTTERLDLRPMDIGDILDQTFRLYRAHFMTFFLIMLAVQALVFLGQLTWQASLLPLHEAGRAVAVVQVLKVMVGFFAFAVVAFLAAQVGIGTLTAAVSAIYLGDLIGIGEALRRVRPVLGKLLGTNLLSAVVVTLGMMACLVPGIYFLLSYLLVSEVVVIEGLGPVAALRRSRDLMRKKSDKGFLRNNITKASVILLITVALASVAKMIVGVPFTIVQLMSFNPRHMPNAFAPLMLLQGILTMIMQAGVGPIGTIAMILFYYDIRVRKEGFDLQVLAAALGAQPVPPVQP